MPSIISATTTSGLVNTADNSGDLQFQTQNGANTITLPNSSGTLATTANLAGLGFKNRIINGGMTIDQRNAGASITNSGTNNQFPVDRFGIWGQVASKYTAQQNAGSVTPPAGFTNYLGITSSSAFTPLGVNDLYMVAQQIEGFNTADLNWGTANAKTVTLSFWVRSSGLTYPATFGGSLQNSAVDRSYPFNYTISTANTWEQKSITVAGDTSGTWIGATNGIGIRVWFALGVGTNYSGTAGAWVGADYRSSTGATNVLGTNGATLYITGVQLEVGSTATSFDYRPYGTEFSLCERYFQKYSGNTTGNPSDGGFVAAPIFQATESYTGLTFPQMRTGPSFSYSSLSHFTILSDGVARSPLTNLVSNGSSNNKIEIYLTWSSNLTAGFSAWLRINTPSGFYSLSAEL